MAYLTVAEFKELQPIASTVNIDITDAVILAQLTKSSAFMDSYLGSQVKLPLATVPDVVKSILADITAYKLLASQGIPINGTDVNLKDAYTDALKWLLDVSTGKASIGNVDSTPDFEEGGTYLSDNSSSNFILGGVCDPSWRWDC